MKKFKKINKGFVLTTIVLIAIIVYFINLEKQRENEKTNIQKVCENYFEIVDQYSVLPEDTSEKAMQEYIKKMKNELLKIMIDNQDAIDIQSKILENNLKNEYDSDQIKIKVSRKIKKIRSYQFDGNKVTVNFSNKIEETIKNNQINEYNSNQDQVILQKIKGEWKIVYANLKFEDSTRDYYYDNMLETTIVN